MVTRYQDRAVELIQAARVARSRCRAGELRGRSPDRPRDQHDPTPAAYVQPAANGTWRFAASRPLVIGATLAGPPADCRAFEPPSDDSRLILAPPFTNSNCGETVE